MVDSVGENSNKGEKHQKFNFINSKKATFLKRVAFFVIGNITSY